MNNPFAFVFPGQGSQSVGMLKTWLERDIVKKTLACASDALDEDIVELMCEGPAEQLNQTINTQPIMLAASYALYCAWREAKGLEPAILAGHSLGEYTALVVAEALNFSDAVKLVRFRAQAMQNAVPAGIGAMAAILGLQVADVLEICVEISSSAVVEAVNFNEPRQVVIAGHREAVEQACELAKRKGAKRALMLPVSAPFHSSLLTSASIELEKYLAGVDLQPPRIPIVNNVDVVIENDPKRIKNALVRQAASPVRWLDCIQFMSRLGCHTMIECGPGKVLQGLIKRIDETINTDNLSDYASMCSIIDRMPR